VSSASSPLAQEPLLAEESLLNATRRRAFGVMFWICAGWIALVVLLALLASVLGLQNPTTENYNSLNQGPTLAHWFGTDDLGRDIFSRVVYGARVSLIVGFGAMVISMSIGASLALLAAYRRGKIDLLVSAASYVMLAFPALVAVIAIIAFWGHDLWKITLIIGVAGIPLVFRVVRAAALGYATRDFVVAAKTQGAGDWRIITKEILPNVLPAMVSFFLIGVASVVILEGALAFLGLSVQPPTPSWGNMISESRTYLSQNPWLALFPSLAMILFLIALNLIGDTLRSALDHQEGKL